MRLTDNFQHELEYDAIRIDFREGYIEFQLMLKDQLMCTIHRMKRQDCGSVTLRNLNGTTSVNTGGKAVTPESLFKYAGYSIGATYQKEEK